MTGLPSGCMIKSSLLTWEREKIVMYEQIVTVRPHTHSQKDDYPATGFCNWWKTLSKNLYDHFVPSQRRCKVIWSDYALKRVQTGQNSLLTKWQLLSKIVPVSAQRACLLSEGFSLYPHLSLSSQRQSQHKRSKQLVLHCHPSNMAGSSAVPVLHKIPK